MTDLMTDFSTWLKADARGLMKRAHDLRTNAPKPVDFAHLVFLGALEAKAAGVCRLPWRKMEYLEKGVQNLDAALALVPGSLPGQPSLGWILVETLVRIPPLFNQGRKALPLAEVLVADRALSNHEAVLVAILQHRFPSWKAVPAVRLSDLGPLSDDLLKLWKKK